MAKRKLSCHDCGAEQVDCESEGCLPAYPSALPCRICLRNKTPGGPVGWYDMYSENWVFKLFGEGKVEPLIEDPNKPEKRMLDVVARVTVKECAHSDVQWTATEH